MQYEATDKNWKQAETASLDEYSGNKVRLPGSLELQVCWDVTAGVPLCVYFSFLTVDFNSAQPSGKHKYLGNEPGLWTDAAL